MEELHKKWEKIHHCLQALEAADQEQEAEILKKAYECLLCAYQESRTFLISKIGFVKFFV